MKRLALLSLLAVATAFGSITGTVTNGTTDKPQGGATVTLYKLGQAGMETVVSVKSAADGKFTIDNDAQGPHLIQTAFDGVTYNHMLPPNAPRTGLGLKVFSSSNKKPAGAKISTHMILIEPSAEAVTVNESFVFKNDSNVSYNDPDGGTLRFTVPENTQGKVKVTAAAPQGMPVERSADEAGAKGAYKVDFPVKPGETRFDVTYALPAGSAFTKKIVTDAPARVVVPQGVTLVSQDLKLLGQEPQTQATIYETTKKEFTAQLQGTGSLQGPASEGGEEEEGGEGLRQIRPRVYERFYFILGLALFMLVVTFLLLYRKANPTAARTAAVSQPAAATGKGKRKA
ncbi:MAG: carboxypeptidase regulatory-like domain-containing protein [Bryobacterales bacterium]|nr:carboxypeptidase regulatory-like domain-containing protein [Bryobacterales bacterium]